MNKVNFEERVKIVPADANALHDETENVVADVLRVVSGGYGDVLFKNAPPVVSHLLGNIQVNIPEQWFTVNGIPGKIPATSFNLPDGAADRWRIFFVMGRVDAIDNRDQFQIVGGVIQVNTVPLVVRKASTPRRETTASGNPLVIPAPPVLGPTDIGYIMYCDIVWDLVTLSVTHNASAIYSFPGAGAGVAAHAATHLGGADPIPDAAMGGPSSTEGLMPIGSFATLMQTLTSLGVDPASPYLTKVISGDNVSAPKVVALRFRHHSSLKVYEVSGVYYLGIKFGNGPFDGTEDLGARRDHHHSPSEFPLSMESERVTVGAVNLGKLLSVPTFGTISSLHSTKAFWAPPGTVSPAFPLVECGWFPGSSGMIGCRVHIVGANEAKLETGGQAFLKMESDLYAYILSAVGGTPTWTYAGSAQYPTSGEIYVRVSGTR